MGDQELPNFRLSIECTVCMEIFKRPKVLTCGHSFCVTCLEQMIRVGRGSFLCPVCREKHSVGEAGVEGLRDNFALKSIVNSLRDTLGNQGDPDQAPQPANRSPTRREADVPTAAAGRTASKKTAERRETPTCVRHQGKKLEACCEQCEDTVCAQCISKKCRPSKHKVTPVKEKAELIRIRLNLLLLGAAFSNLKDNMTLGQGLIEGGKVVAQAEQVREKIFAAHDRALTFAEQRKKQYLEIVEGTQGCGVGAVSVDLQILRRSLDRLDDMGNIAGASTAVLGKDAMQDVVSNLKLAVKDSKRAIGDAAPSGCSFEFIGYPPDGSVGELVYDSSNTVGVLSLSGGRLIVARDDRRVAGVCIGEVYQNKPADVTWLFTLKPANYIANVIFCTLSLHSSNVPEPDQNILIAVGQEIFIIDVNSSKYPTSVDRCPAQGVQTVCPKSMPKNATITGVDWYPVPLPDGGFGFSNEFVIYTTDKCHDLTVVSTTTGLNVKVISSSIFLSLIRCHIVNDDVAMLVRDPSQARVLMIDNNGSIKHTFKAPSKKPDANPTLLCWVENPILMAAILWVPVQLRGWEIVLYHSGNGEVMKTVHGVGETPTGLDGLLPDKMVMCFNDGGVRLCNITLNRLGSTR